MTEMCHQVRDAVALEGKAPDDETIREHLSACAECARFLKSLLAVEHELHELQSEDVSDDVVEALLARPELARPAGSRRTLHWAMGLAAAATIAFVAARVTFLGQRDLLRESEVTSTESRKDDAQKALEGDAVPEAGLPLEPLDAVENFRDVPATPSEAPTTLERQVETRLPRPEPLRKRAQAPNRSLADEDTAGKDVFEEKESSAGGRVAPSTPPPPPAPEPTFEGVEGGIAGGLPSSRVDDKVQAGAKEKNEPAKSESLDIGPATSRPMRQNFQVEAVSPPKKRVHVEPVYTDIAVQARVSGTVILQVTVDREGNVTKADVVQSVPLFDQAVREAVLQWKYEAADVEERTFAVRVDFAPPEDPNDDARLFLEERERIENLRFREARGYWANTYVPGDPEVRFLAMRLRKAEQTVAPHAAARPVAQPFDAPTRAALALSVHADHRGITESSRLLVQVGLQATEDHGRRRPPMNVGIVVDGDPHHLTAIRALVESLQRATTTGDRFRLILPGSGEVVAPAAFRHGPLTVALDELSAGGGLSDAVRLAIERVHAGDDPTMPLGTSLVLVATSRPLGNELDAIARLAHRSAVGGVPVSVIGVGDAVDGSELERLALAGQGRRYLLDQPQDASSIVDRELTASSRVVARAVRLRIKLAEGVKLVDVIGSEPLSERQAERVRETEKAIDLRLSRNLGIDADRSEDEDGIQIVIPSFYAGDAHTILLDVVATRPGPIAEVTARYKDLAELRNTVANASLALPRSSEAPGPLETNVVKNYLAFRLSQSLETAGDTLARGDRGGAIDELRRTKNLLTGLPLGSDREIARDIAMLTEYIDLLSSSTEPALLRYLADSLRYAGAIKERLPQALT